MNFNQQINDLDKKHLLRSRKISENAQGVEMVIDGKKVVNFCSNDYLSLANNEQVKEALVQGVKQYGVGSGA